MATRPSGAFQDSGSDRTTRASPVSGEASAVSATVEEAQAWSSAVTSYKLREERVSLDEPSTGRLAQFRLTCELATPIPSGCLMHSEFLCLDWPIGGVWKIHSLDEDRSRVTCLAYKKTAEPLPATEGGIEGEEKGVAPIFDWQLELGVWEQTRHWFIHEHKAVDSMPGSSNDLVVDFSSALTVRLLAGFSPVEVRFAVNSITSVTTVDQTFDADISWELTFPAITTTRDNGALREFLDALEVNEGEFELANMHDSHSEKPIVSKFVPAGRVTFTDSSRSSEVARRVYHLQRTQRLAGTFKEEMTLDHFPFDQQKLSFTLNMTRGLGPIVPIRPTPVDTASFAVQNFKLGNVFDVVYGDKVFVGEVKSDGTTKAIRFEMVLERKSEYYLTNVALPAAIITYLSFITYAPLEDGEMMDLGSRLQIVSTLVLTCVTFKYTAASLIPQVSYFTLLDTYVFICFVITCVITLENALFPLVVSQISFMESLKEGPLLWLSFGLFTIGNVVWGLYLLRWVKERRRRAKVLLLVYEYVRVMAKAIPTSKKKQVLDGFLERLQIAAADMPEVATTSQGDLFIQLPSDLSSVRRRAEPDTTVSMFRKQALRDLPDIQKYCRELDPAAAELMRFGSLDLSPAVSPAHANFEPSRVEKEKSLGHHEAASVVVVDVAAVEPSAEPEPTQSH